VAKTEQPNEFCRTFVQYGLVPRFSTATRTFRDSCDQIIPPSSPLCVDGALRDPVWTLASGRAIPGWRKGFGKRQDRNLRAAGLRCAPKMTFGSPPQRSGPPHSGPLHVDGCAVSTKREQPDQLEKQFSILAFCSPKTKHGIWVAAVALEPEG
jgi:hypothetical protein